MNKRLESIELMKNLQPFLQGGIMSAQKAKEIVTSFVAGDTSPLNNFILSPDIPMQYMELTGKLKNFI